VRENENLKEELSSREKPTLGGLSEEEGNLSVFENESVEKRLCENL